MAAGWLLWQGLTQAFLPALARTTLPVEGSLPQRWEGEAWLWRPARVSVAPIDGRIHWLTRDQGRVPASLPVVELVDPDRMTALGERREALERERERFDSEQGSRLSELAERREALDREVRAAVADLRELYAGGVASAAEAAVVGDGERLDRLVAALRARAGDRNGAAAEEARLREAAARIEAQAASLEGMARDASHRLVTPAPGFLIGAVAPWWVGPPDGELGRLRPSDLEAAPRHRPIGEGRKVEAGEPIFAIGDPWKVRVALPLPEARAAAILPGEALRLAFRHAGKEREVPARWLATGPAERGVRLLFLEVEQWVDQVVLPERLSLALVREGERGWLLPESAMAMRGGRTGLFVREGGGFGWVPVEVIDRRDGRILLPTASLSPEQPVVVNPWTLFRR